MVDSTVKRELATLLLCAAAGAIWAAPAAGQVTPKGPSIIVETIEARGLLSPAEKMRPAPSHRLSIIDAERVGLLEEPAWRIEGDRDPVTGKRAKLSLPIGSTTVFALGGKLARRTGSTMPDPVEGPVPRAGHKMDGGRVYGAGVERRFGPIEVGATYQYSRISGGAGDDGMAASDGPGRSHSARATVRIRFRH